MKSYQPKPRKKLIEQDLEYKVAVQLREKYGMSMRLSHCMVNAGVGTLEEAAKFSLSEWLRCKFVGRVMINELCDLLQKKGLSLAG